MPVCIARIVPSPMSRKTHKFGLLTGRRQCRDAWKSATCTRLTSLLDRRVHFALLRFYKSGAPGGHVPSGIATGVRRVGSIVTCLMRSRFHVYVTWTFPSRPWTTAGYEYSPGSRSSTSAACHALPLREIATFNGDRPLAVWL